jgi:DNA helicase IV
MQLRMVARRAASGSATLLGDLAQASGVWAPDSWEELVVHLATPAGWRAEELRLGYRSPADVLELAARLAAVAAPGVAPAQAVRSRRDTIRVVQATDSSTLPSSVAEEAARLSQRWRSTAIIGASDDLGPLRQAVIERHLDFGEASSGSLDRPVTLVSAVQAKGLEFDAVVVANPAKIVLDAPRGLRLLYVAITRPTQTLSIVHAGDLPAALR